MVQQVGEEMWVPQGRVPQLVSPMVLYPRRSHNGAPRAFPQGRSPMGIHQGWYPNGCPTMAVPQWVSRKVFPPMGSTNGDTKWDPGSGFQEVGSPKVVPRRFSPRWSCKWVPQGGPINGSTNGFPQVFLRRGIPECVPRWG